MRRSILLVLPLCWFLFGPFPVKADNQQTHPRHPLTNREERSKEKREKYRMKHANEACRQQGYRPGSDSFRSCMDRQLIQMKEQKREQRQQHLDEKQP